MLACAWVVYWPGKAGGLRHGASWIRQVVHAAGCAGPLKLTAGMKPLMATWHGLSHQASYESTCTAGNGPRRRKRVRFSMPGVADHELHCSVDARILGPNRGVREVVDFHRE